VTSLAIDQDYGGPFDRQLPATGWQCSNIPRPSGRPTVASGAVLPEFDLFDFGVLASRTFEMPLVVPWHNVWLNVSKPHSRAALRASRTVAHRGRRL